jgi:Fe-Mn family superoxide dismutase
MAFTLPDLPYDQDALEPYVDGRTMGIHHGKHHQGYTNKLNNAIEGTKWEEMSAEDILRHIDEVPDDVRTAVRNNGGGYVNHKLFWTIMSPDGGGEPSGTLADAIKDTFGSFEAFKEQFSSTASGQFGSGWGWLVVDANGDLHVYSTPNQDSPHMKGHTPILGVDVWEHAYYLHYQNKRGDYISNWWNVVDWDQVAKNYADATQ